MNAAEGDVGGEQVEGGLDEPIGLEPEQGSLALADPGDRHTRQDWEKATAAVLRKARRLAGRRPRRRGLGEADPHHPRRHRGQPDRVPGPGRGTHRRPRRPGQHPRRPLGRPAAVREPGRQGDQRRDPGRPRERRDLGLAAGGSGGDPGRGAGYGARGRAARRGPGRAGRDRLVRGRRGLRGAREGHHAGRGHEPGRRPGGPAPAPGTDAAAGETSPRRWWPLPGRHVGSAAGPWSSTGPSLHDLGASDGQELGYVLATAAAYLRALAADGTRRRRRGRPGRVPAGGDATSSSRRSRRCVRRVGCGPGCWS